MATKRKQDTLTQVERAVSSAAKSAVSAADEYVMQPVSKALGLSSTAKKRRPAAKRTTTKKRTTAKKRGAAGRAATARKTSRRKPATRTAKKRAPARRPLMRAGSGIE